MTLRLRLVLTFGLMALLIAALYGGLTYVLYQRQQWSQLESLLNRELERMEGALSNRELGVPFFETERGGTIVQLVTNGRVVLPRPASAVLPATEELEVVSFDGRRYMSALRPLAGGSSVRVGLDVTSEVQAGYALARQLVWLGLLLALLAALTVAILARRTLAPLTSVARQARSVDPSSPAPVEYHGPNDEVWEVVSALNAALENIRQRRQEERSFLSEVAHELAAPLTLVKGHLDAYERHGSSTANGAAGSDSGGAEHLQAAREAAQELLLTSQDLLAVARGELDRAVHNEVFSLDELLARLTRAYPGIRLHADGPVRVVGDSHQLLQAIRNLVRNAVQASGGTEGVTVDLTTEGESVVLRVRDSGPGIPPERLERIFERYFSGSSGAGVGLTVVSRIVEQHGGELRVETTSAGSCFTVTLPSFAAQLATSP
ncbi:MAG: HAMP domain-containing sensor histidine kinase [Trueperaceae bacterium]